MIPQVQSRKRTGLLQPHRGADVRSRRRRISARMVMEHDEIDRARAERLDKDLSGFEQGNADAPPKNSLLPDQVHLRIEENRHRLLLLKMPHILHVAGCDLFRAVKADLTCRCSPGHALCQLGDAQDLQGFELSY